MIAITLNKDISCEHICTNINKMIQKYKQNNPTIEDIVLTIDIKHISYDDSLMIPKIEHKNI